MEERGRMPVEWKDADEKAQQQETVDGITSSGVCPAFANISCVFVHCVMGAFGCRFSLFVREVNLVKALSKRSRCAVHVHEVELH